MVRTMDMEVGYLPSTLTSSKETNGAKQEQEESLCPESLRRSMAELYARVDEELSQRIFYSERCRELSEEMKQYSGVTEGAQSMVSTIVIADLLIQLEELQSKNREEQQPPQASEQSLLDSNTQNETIQGMSLLDSQISKHKSSKKALAQSLSQAASKIVALRTENDTLRAELESCKQKPVLQKEDAKLRSELQTFKKNLAKREIQIDALLCLNEVNEERGLRARTNLPSDQGRGRLASGKRVDDQSKDSAVLKSLKDKVAELEKTYQTENFQPTANMVEALSEGVPTFTPSKAEREIDSDISLENYYTPTSTRTGNGSDVRYSPLKVSLVTGIDSVASKENNGALSGCKPVAANGILGPSLNNPGHSVVN
eukprot:Nitzschia sp. Nitz4//scaffold11_size288233//248403//249515//NITZ4_000815-RA/size288233-processed-gene-0.196-mRNA-1//1//CDS//3329534197//1124//frame0